MRDTALPIVPRCLPALADSSNVSNGSNVASKPGQSRLSDICNHAKTLASHFHPLLSVQVVETNMALVTEAQVVMDMTPCRVA